MSEDDVFSRHWHWFQKEWWKYLFTPRNADYSWTKTVWCRMNGHPCGVVWYSNGWEPDMHCKNCGDDLG